jgi:predicted NUDIX family phosphoesterase
MRSGRVVDEPLIVVPVRHLRAANLAQGFDPSPEPILATVLKPNVARVMPRSVAEADPRFKQIVCYVIVRSQGLVFHYLRSAGAGERRLAGRRSLGLGGHLNADDADGALDHQGLQRAIQRELDEEVALGDVPSIRYLGIINDDSTEVGRVHVGLVALADLPRPDVRLRDTTLQDGRFDRPEDLAVRAAAFETWSQLCLPALISPPETS